MTRSPLVSDLAIALIGAILILVLTPGVAVAGMIALLVLIICGVNLTIDTRRRGRAVATGRSRPAPSSPRGAPERRTRAAR